MFKLRRFSAGFGPVSTIFVSFLADSSHSGEFSVVFHSVAVVSNNLSSFFAFVFGQFFCAFSDDVGGSMKAKFSKQSNLFNVDVKKI